MQQQWDLLAPYTRLLNLDDIEPRAYQINIAKSVFIGDNSLVVLPTGLGKTLIAAFAIAKALHSGKKALILAPTKPLSEQHYSSLVKLLNIEQSSTVLFTGTVSGSKRAKMVEYAKVIAATPQTIANDLGSGRMTLDEFGVVVIDECHRSVGRYAYTYIADECKQRGVQLVGLTASPGSNTKKIRELIETLGIRNIEIRTSADIDVAPYVVEKDHITLYVEKDNIISSILAALRPLVDKHIENLYTHGLSPFRSVESLPRGRLLEIGDAISKIQAKNYKFMAVSDYVYVLNLSHAYDLASTEGIYPFVSYINSLMAREKQGRTLKALLASQEVKNALKIASDALQRGAEHPKMLKLIDLIKTEFADNTIIVFAQYRSTIKQIAELLAKNGVSAKQFTGKREGFTQEAQRKTIDQFRSNEFRVLVASSIGEEGLDIPSVDAVIFYEPVPSEIRTIQRKGRAGRIKFGRVIVMVTRETKDERYLMISRLREKRMAELVTKIKTQLERGSYWKQATPKPAGQLTL